MVVVVKDLQNQIVFEHELVRFMEANNSLFCMIQGNYLSVLPNKGRLYTVEITDTTTQVSVSKLAIFNNYNFVLDGTGSTPQINDNTLVFLIA